MPSTPPGRTPFNHPWYAAGSGVTLASVLLLAFPRRRRFGALFLVALSAAVLGGATGCGSSNTAVSASSTKSDVGSYVVTITATNTSSSNVVTTHSTTVTFAVQ